MTDVAPIAVRGKAQIHKICELLEQGAKVNDHGGKWVYVNGKMFDRKHYEQAKVVYATYVKFKNEKTEGPIWAFRKFIAKVFRRKVK